MSHIINAGIQIWINDFQDRGPAIMRRKNRKKKKRRLGELQKPGIVRTSQLLSSMVVVLVLSSFLLLFVGAVITSSYGLGRPFKKITIPPLGGFSLLHGWQFFVRRHDFLQSGFKKMGAPIYSFRVMQVSC